MSGVGVVVLLVAASASSGAVVTTGPASSFGPEAVLHGQADPLPQALGRFGHATALSGDTLVIGAPGSVEIPPSEAGAAYVFVRSGGSWALQQRLAASDPREGRGFGTMVAVSGDTVVVGSGAAAYVFVRSGGAWTEQQRIVLAAATSPAQLALSGDTLVVGARRAIVPPFPPRLAGATFVYVRSGAVWTLEQQLPLGEELQGAVALSGDTVAVGYPSVVPSPRVTVLVRSGTAWTLQQELTGTDAAPLSAFGRALAIEGDRLMVGAPAQVGPDAAPAGAVYVFTRAGSVWAEQQKLTASDSVPRDHFGSSVALFADTLAVGAYKDGGPTPGAAYVFTLSGASWSEQQKLVSSDGAAGETFGYSVALEEDTLVVGAPTHDWGGARDAGAGYVFTGAGSAWAQQQKLTGGPDRTTGDRLGGSSAVEGDTLVVGAPGDNTPGGVDAGSAYVFLRTGAGWSLQQKLTASDAAAGRNFGQAVALSGDTVAVGAPGDNVTGPPGTAYVFVRSGGTWTEQQRLTPSDSSVGDRFGEAVALDGETAAVGTGWRDAAYVFVRTGTAWSEQQKLAPAGGIADEQFGLSLALSGDTVLVGAPLGPGVVGGAGAAYALVRSGGVWSQQQRLTALEHPTFGFATALEGDTALVGAHRHRPITGDLPGAAYVFVRSGGAWTEQQRITASDGLPFDDFGAGVGLTGDTAAIGARGGTTGAAYLFTRSGDTWSEQEKLLAPGGAAGDAFGTSIALSGATLAVGAIGADTANEFSSGAVFVFRDQPVADLSITLDDAPDPVTGLQPLVYTLTVANAGPEEAAEVRVSHALPAGATLQSAGGVGWDCVVAGATVTCTRPSLPTGVAPEITVVVAAPPTAQVASSTATVTAPVGDPVPGNNSDTETTTVTDAPQADLEVMKTDGGAVAEWGQPITWTISVHNAGPGDAFGTRVTDAFPPGVTGVTWNCIAISGSSCSVASGSGDIDVLVNLPAGGLVGFGATGTVQPGAAALVNTATAAPPATTYDPDPADNTATVVTPPAPQRYFAVPPCRVVDTRVGQAPLAANTTRAFTLAGSCGIPADARVVAANLVAVNPGDRGNLRVFPLPQSVPEASVLNFAAGRTRANNAVLALGAAGQVQVRCDMPAGSTASTHFVVDVFGYFR